MIVCFDDCVYVTACVCVCACVHACVRTCVRACVRACLTGLSTMRGSALLPFHTAGGSSHFLAAGKQLGRGGL